MSKRLIGIILALVGSLVIGFMAGQQFFRIFDKTVPQGAMTDLVRAGTHTTYIFAGLMFGVVIFAWSLVIGTLARFFPGGSKTKAPERAAPDRS